jgi:hypothetical protein
VHSTYSSALAAPHLTHPQPDSQKPLTTPVAAGTMPANAYNKHISKAQIKHKKNKSMVML